MTPELERLLSVPVGDDLARRALDDLRELCRRGQEWEDAVSLTRRLAQGRLDVLGYEARRRAGSDAPAGTPSMLFDLPDILADEHAGGAGRAVAVAAPGRCADALVELLDRAADPVVLGRPEDVADDDLAALADRLAAFEQELSGVRRALHERLDTLRAEIGRRYRDGEASVEALFG